MIPPNPPSDLPPPGNQPDDFWNWSSLDEPAPPHGPFESSSACSSSPCSSGRSRERTRIIEKKLTGHLIPDDKYEPEFEGCRVVRHPSGPRQVPAERLRDLIIAEGHDLDLVHSLQAAHDNAATYGNFLAAFRSKARYIAAEYDLNDSACDLQPEVQP